MGTRSALETPTPVASEEAREALQRILVSRTFSKAPRLCSLLQYIVENSLIGRFDNITEQQIGIQIFNRSPGYNSGEDTIVRGTARHLRQRLEQYYADEGHAERLRISVPKGGYIAHFETVDNVVEPASESIASQPIPFPPSTESTAVSWPLTARVAISLLVALATLLPLAVYLWMRPGLPAKASDEPHILWPHFLHLSARPSLSPATLAWTPISLGSSTRCC